MWLILLLFCVNIIYVNSSSPAVGWNAFCSSSLAEQETEVPLAVRGHIPDWLKGSFLKNAAGRYSVGTRSLGNYQVLYL